MLLSYQIVMLVLSLTIEYYIVEMMGGHLMGIMYLAAGRNY